MTITLYPYGANYGYEKQFQYDTAGNFMDTDKQHVYDSLRIENNVYYDVVVNDRFYYNKTHGVLQIIDNENNALLTLIP